MHVRTVALSLVGLSLLASPLLLCAAEVHQFEPRVEKIGTYRIDHRLVFGNRDLSGIACLTDEQCMIASDEGVYVQVCVLSKEEKAVKVSSRRYRPDLPPGIIELLSPNVASEIDIEAVTVMDGAYYIVGSHGVAKNSGLWMEPRHTCFRLKLDPETGKLKGRIEQSTMKHALAGDPILRSYYAKVLQQRGVNIEGLAGKNGTLYIGFRAPNLAGNIPVIEIGADELFSKKKLKKYRMHKLPLGRGLGIRDMAAIDPGFLMIVGNAGSEPGDSDNPDTKTNVKDFNPGRGYHLVFWDGADGLQKIGEIPRDDARDDPEAMTVLTETDDSIEMLILSDGPRGGHPTVYRIRKRPR